MSNTETIIVNEKEVTQEELNQLKEDASKGKIKLNQLDENGKEFKKLDKMFG